MLSPESEQALRQAVRALESERLAGRLAEYASQPVDRILRFLPRAANDRLNSVVRSSMLKCLDVAIHSLTRAPSSSRPWQSSVMAGITGGIGGAFGLVALPIELPLTTTLMLRSIANIARLQGEDLTLLPSRLACMEVFALGPQRADRGNGNGSGDSDGDMDVGYYAARALLTRLTNESALLLLERGMADVSTPAIARFVTEISSRFGLVLSERVAAGAVPVLGAVSGAAVNALFMDHFQRLAQGHFMVRRLEREYGPQVIRERYASLAEPIAG
jgi:EcsC protein family